MTYKDFLLDLQKSCHQDHQHCTMLLNALCKLMAQAGVEQVPVTLSGLGTFTSRKHPEYLQEDPQSGRMTLYPPRISYRMQTEDLDTPQDALVKQLSENTHVSVDDARAFLEGVVRVIYDGLNHGEDVEVKGLGVFRNIVTHQGELQRVAYTPDQQMRQQVNAPFNCFEPVPADGALAPVLTEEKPHEETTQTEVVEKSAVSTQNAAETGVDTAGKETVAEAVMITPTHEEMKEDTATARKVENTEKDMKRDESEDWRQQDEDDEYEDMTPERHRHRLMYTMMSLLILACIGLVWFILSIDKDESEFDYMPRTYAEANVEAASEEESEEVYLDVEETEVEDPVVAEEETVEVPLTEEPKVEEPKVEKQAETQKPAEAQTTTEAKAPAEPQKPAETQRPAETKNTASGARLKNADGSDAIHVLKAGERLTLVALEHYGDKSFWPYVYEVNRDKIKSPGLVTVGMKLYLPDPAYFGIDANNPESIRKAKNAAAALNK